ncbi:MAG TPA: outer membrane beta-barrel protein [Acidobacteriaceae bacterium]|jgi:hypothetical protein
MFRLPVQFRSSRPLASSRRKQSSSGKNGFSASILIRAAGVAALLVSSVVASAQSAPAWDVYGGVAVQHYKPLFASSPVYKYGWDFSIAQRAYPSHPWVAGQIEASGVYGSTPGTSPVPGAPPAFTFRSDLYTAMAGPIVYLPLHKIRPFAHLLLGGVITANTVSGTGIATGTGTKGYFGTQGGGGVDVRMTHRTWLRGQGDWLRIWQIGDTNTDTFRLTGGVVYMF